MPGPVNKDTEDFSIRCGGSVQGMVTRWGAMTAAEGNTRPRNETCDIRMKFNPFPILSQNKKIKIVPIT